MQFPAIAVTRKSGGELFRAYGVPLGFDLLSFWQWVASDLTNNSLRGTLAEYLVAQALGNADGVRVEWDCYDLKSPSGALVEVKSAAYFQTWAQASMSSITFDIAPTLAWNSAANARDSTARRQADVYVFALLEHRDKLTLDPLDVDQWAFFVLRTETLNYRVPAQKTISLGSLRALNPTECRFPELLGVIEQLAAKMR